MLYDTDSWLEILSYTDPRTVCRFSRTCLWAKRLTDAHFRSLPRVVMQIDITILRHEFVCYVKCANGQPVLETDFTSDIQSPSAPSCDRCDRCPKLHDALSGLKYADIEEIELNHISVASATVARVIETTRFVNARHYSCQISLLKVCTLSAERASIDTLLNGLKILDVTTSFERSCNSAVDFPKLLLEAFEPKDCFSISFSTHRIICTVSTIIKFLRMSIGKPPATARIQIDFKVLRHEQPYTLFFEKIVAMMTASKLLLYYDAQSHFQRKFDEKLQLKLKGSGHCFWIKRLFIDQLGNDDTYVLRNYDEL